MQPTPLVDIGINLTHESYDRDREAVLARARAAGVTRLILTGADVDSSARATEVTTEVPLTLRSTVGIHPHRADECTHGAVSELAELSVRPSVVAIGECGLDYYRMLQPRAVQITAMERQLELATRRRLPLFLHCRDAHEDFLAVLAAAGPARPRAVVHCFTGTVAEVQACLAAGLYVGLTGYLCDERRGAHLGDVAASIPPGRLMLETDGPYLLPRDLPNRPKDRRNEPAFLPHIARAVARARREPPEQLARHTTDTAKGFFGLAAVPERHA